MKINRTTLMSSGLVIASFLMTAVLYPRLPERVPTHWNASGVADDFAPKPWGPFVLPLVMLGVWLLLSVLPHVSPRGYRIERFGRVFEILALALTAFLFLVTLLALLAGIGVPIAMDRAIVAGAGLLFAVIGNFLGKVTKNFFVGIRTPWTLANDEVWLRTHRLGGKLFVLTGIGLFVSGLVGGGPAPLLLAVAVAGGVPAIYSYVLYRRLVGFKKDAGDRTARAHASGSLRQRTHDR